MVAFCVSNGWSLPPSKALTFPEEHAIDMDGVAVGELPYRSPTRSGRVSDICSGFEVAIVRKNIGMCCRDARWG